jgi:hypothetical protein
MQNRFPTRRPTIIKREDSSSDRSDRIESINNRQSSLHKRPAIEHYLHIDKGHSKYSNRTIRALSNGEKNQILELYARRLFEEDNPNDKRGLSRLFALQNSCFGHNRRQ